MGRIILRPTGDQRYGTMGGWGGGLLGNSPVPNALGQVNNDGYWFHEDGGVICTLQHLNESQLAGQQVLAVRIAHREEQRLLDNGWVMSDLIIGDEAYRPARVYYQDGFGGWRTKTGPAVYKGRRDSWTLAEVNSMRLQVGAARGDDWGPDKSKRWSRASQAWIEVITPAPLARPALSNLATSSVNPVMSVNITGIEPEQMVAATFQVAADSSFTRDVREYTTPMNEENSSSVTLSYRGIPGTDSHANLSPGVWYYRVKSFDMLNNESQWSATRTITVSLTGQTLPVPSLTSPTSGTHRNPLMERSATFSLGINPSTGMQNWTPGDRLLGVEWRFAPNSGFTGSNVVQWRNYQGTFGGNTPLVVSYDPTPVSSREPFGHGPQVSVQDPDQTLRPQGTWYAQVRSIDSFGNASAWSPAVSFAVEHKPQAENLQPSGGDFDPAVSSFRWTFSDPWNRDSQSAYRVTLHEGLALVYDSGKVYSSVNGANVDEDLGSAPRNLKYGVQLWDSDDEAGPVASSTFRYRLAPQVTILGPVGSIDTGQPVVSWQTAFSDNESQSQFRVIISNTTTGNIEYDSGSIASVATTHTVQTTTLTNMATFEVRVYVFDSGDLTGWGASLFETNFIVPQHLDTTAYNENYESGGYVDVWWTGDIDPFFEEFRIYRRRYTPDLTLNEGWELSGIVTNASQRHFKDFSPAGACEFEFSVVQVANRYGSKVEGAKRSTIGARVMVFSTDYWLIIPGDEENSIRLHSVVGDSFTDRHESNSYEIVGGGTRVNRGDRIGLEGSLSCSIRASTVRGARAQMDLIRSIGDEDGYMILRDPFGNTTKIAVGDVSAERIGGVGAHEFADIEIPYTEVA